MSTSNPTFCRAVAEALGKTYNDDGFFTWIVETKLGPARVAVTLDDDIHVTFIRSAFSEEEQTLADSLCIDTSKSIAWTIRRSETSPHLGLAMDLAMIQRMTYRLESAGWEKPQPSPAPEPVRDALVKALDGLLARYVGLVESGDAGSWDAEAESCVIDARAALKLAKNP